MKTSTAKTFDPFVDRTARDIRNGLSEAFVAAWTDAGKDYGPVAEALRKRHTQPVYQAYIHGRMVAYQAAIDGHRTLNAPGLLDEMMLLWNQGLFFEVHELLENQWHAAQGGWREVLKTLIQAAAVYVHSEAGRLKAARKMGMRVSNRLDELRVHLGAIANLDELCRALEHPEGRPPRLEGNHR